MNKLLHQMCRTSDTNVSLTGLQTPRLKRLAEIVSAQAIAQQEKMEAEEYEEGEGEIEGGELVLENVEEVEADGA